MNYNALHHRILGMLLVNGKMSLTDIHAAIPDQPTKAVGMAIYELGEKAVTAVYKDVWTGDYILYLTFSVLYETYENVLQEVKVFFDAQRAQAALEENAERLIGAPFDPVKWERYLANTSKEEFYIVEVSAS
jgi:hypothetical protein